MSEVTRFSVSLEPELLADFDRYCQSGQFATRSEAIRQLLRQTLTTAAWQSDAAEMTATLTLVYDHHRAQLSRRLLELQHNSTQQIVASLHVHLDHDHCMEVIVLRGRPSELQLLAARLRGLKGVHRGELVPANALPPATDQNHTH
jgi:CopG family nickel-responsive transcriptional regulator